MRLLFASLVLGLASGGPAAFGQSLSPPAVIDLAGQALPRAVEANEPSPFGGKSLIVRNVTHPTLSVFSPPAGQASGAALVIAPGGGFQFLSIESEGEALARRLAAQGVTAFVLRYRTDATPADPVSFRRAVIARFAAGGVKPEALAPAGAAASQDGAAAIGLIRAEANRFGVDPHRIGFVGFSAGGWVALATARASGPERPDIVAAVYPAHPPDFAAETGAPPLFLSAATDDPLLPVETQLDVYRAWRKARRPVELHLYARGGHGYGVDRQGAPSDAWIEAFEAWLRAQGWLTKPGGS